MTPYRLQKLLQLMKWEERRNKNTRSGQCLIYDRGSKQVHIRLKSMALPWLCHPGSGCCTDAAAPHALEMLKNV
jgi:hypothetical protein